MLKTNYGLKVMQILFGLALLGHFSSNGWSISTKPYRNVSADQFVKMLDQKDFTLINVHIPYQGEIAGTDLLIPFNTIDRDRNQLPDDKDAKMVVYCMMGPMGRIAAQKLVSMGYRQVIHLQGGMMAWQNVGKKLVIRSD
jgi:rhodanese-related sulfurtransferase